MTHRFTRRLSWLLITAPAMLLTATSCAPPSSGTNTATPPAGANAASPSSSSTSSSSTSAATRASNATTFSALLDEYKAARDAYQATMRREAEAQIEQLTSKRVAAEKALAEAKTDDEIAAAQSAVIGGEQHASDESDESADGPGADFAPRFLQFAIDHPQDAEVVTCLTWAMRTSGGPKASHGIWHRALELLAKNHASSLELAPVVQLTGDVHDDRSREWLRSVIADHPDRKLQARAAKALGNGLVHSAEYGEFLQSNDAVRERTIAQMGAEYVESLVSNSPSARRDGEALLQRVRTDYADVLPDLSIGQTAPEVVSKDLDDKVARLSELRGKIVVLDIWATWCGPCVAMIPHERGLVQRLRDKPFALVSISADEEKSTLVDFLAKNDMPWTHWWNGRSGGLLEAWDIQYFPTIYVIDAQGKIRYTDVVGEELDDAVDALIAEMESSS